MYFQNTFYSPPIHIHHFGKKHSWLKLERRDRCPSLLKSSSQHSRSKVQKG